MCQPQQITKKSLVVAKTDVSGRLETPLSGCFKATRCKLPVHGDFGTGCCGTEFGHRIGGVAHLHETYSKPHSKNVFM